MSVDIRGCGVSGASAEICAKCFDAKGNPISHTQFHAQLAAAQQVVEAAEKMNDYNATMAGYTNQPKLFTVEWCGIADDLAARLATYHQAVRGS